MRYLYLIIFSLLAVQAMAEDYVRGMTENLPTIQNFTVEKNEKGFRRIISENNPTVQQKINAEIPWILADESDLDITIPPNGFGGFMIEQYTNKLIPINSYIDNAKINQAIAKAPKWLRNRLQLNLSLLKGTLFIDIYSDMIINAEEPYIDEIAFVIANTSAELLMSKYFYPELIVQNAKSVYSHDADLKYVDIVEYGSLQSGDYYSTVVYKKKNIDGQVEQIEVPYEIYYWYIVFPKLSDEIPTFVHPTRVECSLDNTNHTLNITTPAKGGVFWRDYLYEHTELKDSVNYYPILKDMASEADYLWDESNTETKTALGELTSWVKSVMTFTSKDERPHQPVRIYNMHIGRCGEHEDLTNAIARACLIPSRGISAISEDHVWNEFWDKDWQQWEPVNTSYYNKAAYGEEGWGKLFGSVYARRGDGVTFPVTDQGYSKNTAPMTIKVVDKNKVPIDGAFVALYKKRVIDGKAYIFLDSYGTTNFQGEYKFVVGYKNTYYAAVKTQYGNSPVENNKVMPLIENPVKDKIYEFEFEIPKAKTIVSGTPVKAFDSEDYKLTMEYQATNSTSWLNYMDDLQNMPCYWSSNSKTASAFMLLNELEFNNLNNSIPFNYAENEYFQCSDGTFDVSFERWWYNYALFYNGYNSLNPLEIKVHAKLWANPATSVKSVTPAEVKLYPNPASDYIAISFNEVEMNLNQGVKIEIVNSLGEILLTTNITDNQLIDISKLPAGVYYSKIHYGNEIAQSQFVIMR